MPDIERGWEGFQPNDNDTLYRELSDEILRTVLSWCCAFFVFGFCRRMRNFFHSRSLSRKRKATQNAMEKHPAKKKRKRAAMQLAPRKPPKHAKTVVLISLNPKLSRLLMMESRSKLVKISAKPKWKAFLILLRNSIAASKDRTHAVSD